MRFMTTNKHVVALLSAALVWCICAEAAAFCGDGHIFAPEQCDYTTTGYNNHQNIDVPVLGGETCYTLLGKFGTLGCKSNCTFDTSGCTSTAGQLCGNGVVEPGEQCDDQGPQVCDRCYDNCLLNEEPIVCGNSCIEDGEECDNGSDNSDWEPDACRATYCRNAYCGDEVTDTGEACDDGVNNSDYMPDGCREGCIAPSCGDGVRDPGLGEQCDLGAQNSNAVGSICTTQCIIPSCGNGTVEGAELCDDGNLSNSDACTAQCRWNYCGDGFIRTGLETCDDGDDLSTGSCSYDCGEELSQCGNGILDDGEECDEGTANADVANADCRTDCSLPRCGDGVVDLGEECDRQDGCGPLCTWRP